MPATPDLGRPEGGRAARRPTSRSAGPPRHLAAQGGRTPSTPTRSSPTTWPTRRPRVAMARAALDYGAKGDTEAALACAFVADAVCTTLAAKVLGREAPGASPRAPSTPALPVRRRLPGPRLPGALAARRAPPPRRRLRDGPGHFRRFAEERIRPVAEHVHRTNSDIPETVIAGPGRDGRLRAVGPRGVRRLRLGRRERLPGHGGRHRGAVPGLARRRRLPHHPARDPDPGPGQGRDRGAEAGTGCPSSPAARSWRRWRSPSPTSAPTWPGSR